MKTQEIMMKLTANHLFSDVSESQLASFLELAELQQLSKGTVLYTKGEHSNETFSLVLSGCLHVLGEDNTLTAIRQPGDVLGEIALFIPQHQRTYTVFAAESSEILVWQITQVKEYMPSLRRKLFRLVWQRLPADFVLD